ncbi:hypothetical protein ACG1BZ_17285 [Microbulbifer sp. CNSA002]|uniref:hypothetical protein n=1 Tax=Microbulbifer sp. CNSA002 TaxID=3373604 RepID=UPI0039B36FA3
MKPLILLAFMLCLSSCVVYPERHISEPRYEISIAGGSFVKVQITSVLEAKAGTCEGGSILYLEEGMYISEPVYGWIKMSFMVPIDSFKPIKICAIEESGKHYYWEENTGIFGNDYPKSWKFKCEVTKGALSCEKVT